jgi:hypothetical protein
MRNPRNQMQYFIESLTEYRKAYFEGDTLCIKGMGSKVSRYIYSGSGAFRSYDEGIATVIGGIDPLGNRYLQEGRTYLERGSQIWHFGKIIVLLFALLSGILTVFLWPLIWLIQFIRKRKTVATKTNTSITIAFIGLGISFGCLATGMDSPFHLGTVNVRSLLLFICTWLLAIGVLTAVYFYWVKSEWSGVSNKLHRIALSTKLICATLLVVYLAYHGWIGMRLWNY